MKTTITAPTGKSGLAVEPWSKGEVYAVAANWAQASDPVLSYGQRGWDIEECGRQVADFRHSARAALESVIRRAIEAGGDTPDDDEVEGLCNALSPRNALRRGATHCRPTAILAAPVCGRKPRTAILPDMRTPVKSANHG
jgi:hypothetical protein